MSSLPIFLSYGPRTKALGIVSLKERRAIAFSCWTEYSLRIYIKELEGRYFQDLEYRRSLHLEIDFPS